MKQSLGTLYRRLGPLWWNTLKMFFASRIGDVIALAIGLWIVPTLITGDNLGAVMPVLRMAGVIGLPILIFQLAALKYINIHLNQQAPGKIKKLIRDLAAISVVYSLLLCLLAFAFNERIMASLKIHDPAVIWWVLLLTLLAFWQPLAMACAQGLKQFNAIILTKIVSPCIRLLAMLALLRSYQISGFLAAQVLAGLSAVFVLMWPARDLLGSKVKTVSYFAEFKPMMRYVAKTSPFIVLVILQLFLEPWIIRNRLPTGESGAFYMAATFGNIVLWVAPAMLPFLFPLVSEQHEKGESSKKLYWQSMAFILVVGLGISCFLLLSSKWLLGLTASWSTYSDYWIYLPYLALIATLTTLINTHITYAQAVRRFHYNYYYAPILSIGLVILLVVGHSSYGSLAVIVAIMLVTRLVICVGIAIEERLAIRGDASHTEDRRHP